MQAITEALKAKMENFGMGEKIPFEKFFFVQEDGTLKMDVDLLSWTEERKKEKEVSYEYRSMNGAVNAAGYYLMAVVGVIETSGGQPTGNVFGYKNLVE